MGGDWHLAQTIPERVRAVGAKDVQRFAKEYMRRMQWGSLGPDGAEDAD